LKNKVSPQPSSILDVAHQPIGIFDSGIGGLSIAKFIMQQLPNEQLIYVADSLHAPYGEKPTEFIIERVNRVAKILQERKVKAMVIACNTATVNAIDQLRATIDIPIIGVEPAIKPAAIYSKTKKVGILVTQATANNKRFLALIQRFSNGAQVLIQPCPGLVELIEQGKMQSHQCTNLLAHYLTPLINQGVDTIVLGCTHYPLLQKKIVKLCGPQVKIMDTAAPVTNELQRQLLINQIPTTSQKTASIEFLSSSPSSSLDKLSASLINQAVNFKLF